MEHYDEKLKQLRAHIARFRQLGTALEPLRERKKILESRVWNLNYTLQQQETQAEQLKKTGLTTFFLGLRGKLDEKRAIAQAEVQAARIQYEAASRELESVNAELAQTQQERAALLGCEERYEAMFKEKQAHVRSSGGEAAEKLLAMEEALWALKVREKELSEALQAGEAALQTTRQILDRLNSAKNWGTWDLVGGGLISDLAKHSHLDEAQALVERLQGQLRRFQAELTDVQVKCSLQIQVDGFLRFADYFFDGILSSWTVLDRIGSARDQVLRVQSQIEDLLSSLKSPLANARAEGNKLLSGISALVLEAQ